MDIKIIKIKILLIYLTIVSVFLLLCFYMCSSMMFVLNPQYYEVGVYSNYFISLPLLQIDLFYFISTLFGLLLFLSIIIYVFLRKKDNMNNVILKPKSKYCNVHCKSILSEANLLDKVPIYVVDDETLNANANANGFFKNKSNIVITNDLFDLLSLEQLQSVVAHEAAHINNNDIKIKTISICFIILVYSSILLACLVGVFSTILIAIILILAIVGLALLLILMSFVFSGGDNFKFPIALLFSVYIFFRVMFSVKFDEIVFALLILILYLIIAFSIMLFIVSVLKFAFMREREHKADIQAIKYTNKPVVYIETLIKIQKNNTATEKYYYNFWNFVSAPLYFSGSLKDQSVRIKSRYLKYIYSIFNTHPTLEKRILRIKKHYRL